MPQPLYPWEISGIHCILRPGGPQDQSERVQNILLPLGFDPWTEQPKASRYTDYTFMTFNRIQSRVVTGLLMGHNTLRRHLYLLGLLDRPLCRKCRVEEETSAHILCECKALASLRHAYLGSIFLEPEDIRSLGLGANWNYSKVAGLP